MVAAGVVGNTVLIHVLPSLAEAEYSTSTGSGCDGLSWCSEKIVYPTHVEVVWVTSKGAVEYDWSVSCPCKSEGTDVPP